jgi:hypothetical protein
MRRLGIATTVSVTTLVAALALATSACDQLNRPMSTSSSSSSSSSGGSSVSGSDGGALTDEGGTLTPTISPQPGDIQL